MKYFKIVVVFLLLTKSMFSFYEDKEGYPYKEKIFDVYISAKGGSSIATAFGDSQSNHLFRIEKMLASGAAMASIGANIWDFRFETEYSYLYNWTSIIQDAKLYSSELNTSAFPKKGQEVLKNAFAINVYYNMKFFSEILYPYIGVGTGKGTSVVVFRDYSMQPNGLGEQYHGRKNVAFTNFIVGFEYHTKIIKSSVGIEYRYTKTSPYKIKPLNYDGLSYITDAVEFLPGGTSSQFPADYTAPKEREISSVFHSIIFSFKYYLY